MYLDAVREVLGTIDLDPASSHDAQQTVQAARFYTAQENGLARAWYGRMFLNPPYAQPLIELFITRLVEEFRVGHVSEAILLTNNSTETHWFRTAEAAASRLCFTKKRIPFVDTQGHRVSPTNGNVFFYFGAQEARFREVFQAFGVIR
jgi:DNA N-6-adenine-methyltransferase (Dam)